MADPSTLGDDALTQFGGGGTKFQRQFLRFIAAAAYAEHQRDRRHANATALTERALAIGRKILSAVEFPGDLEKMLAAKSPAASAALRAAFKAAGV